MKTVPRPLGLRSLGMLLGAAALAALLAIVLLQWRSGSVESPPALAGGVGQAPTDLGGATGRGGSDPLSSSSRVDLSASGAAPEAPGGPSAVARVIDALSGEPIASARARTHPAGGGEVAGDTAGWIDVGPLLASSAVAVDVSAEAHFPGRFQRAALEAELEAGTQPLLRLQPAATLRARVVSERGEPLPGVNLELWLREEKALGGSLREHVPVYSPAGTLDHLRRTLEAARAQGAPTPRIEDLGVIEAVTDEHGEFLFPPLPADLALVVRCGGSVQPAEVEVRLPVSPEETVVELIGRAGARVTGRLVRGAEPLGQERVQIDSAASRKQWEAYTSLADGSFAVDGVEPGRATLFVEQPGFELFEFEVVPPEIDLGVLLVPELSLCTGRLLSGQPFAGPETFAVSFASGRSPWVGVRTDREGRFRVELPAGRYEAIFAVAGMPSVAGSFIRRSVAAPFTDLELDVDPHIGSIGFVLDGGATGTPSEIEATLFLRGAEEPRSLRSYGQLPRLARSLAVDEAGGAAWHHLVPGRYDLSLEGAEFGAAFVTDVDLRAGSATELGRLELGVARLRGRVRGAGEDELDALELAAVDLAGQRIATPLDEDGAYALERLAPGPWRIELGPRTLAPRLRRETLLRVGENLLDLELPPSARIEGRLAAGDVAVSGASAQLLPGGLPRVGLTALARAESDAEGRFVLDGIAPGAYLLVVEAPGAPRRSLRADLELAEGELRSVELRLEPGRGEVRFSLGGEVLLDLQEVWAFVGALPEPVEFTTAATTGEGWFALPASSEPIRFLLRRASQELDPTAWVHLPRPYVLAVELPAGLRAGERREVPIDGPMVELRHPAGLPRTLLPTLDLEGFAGFDLLRHLPPYSIAALERHPDRVRFGPVPPGARLVLTGIDEEGRLREQRFTVEGDTTLDWP